jgi:curved DNA-binding protein CbpA
MAKSYYETLGVSPSSRSSEIKAAYRKLVLKHHPDKNSDPASPQVFRGIAEAFEVLGDPSSRKRYDDSIALEAAQKRELVERKKREEDLRIARLKQEAERAQRIQIDAREPVPAVRSATTYTARDISEMVKRLSILFSRQRVADCESLARQIISIDPRQSLPYAVLGDIARSRGGLADAMKMYSFALQMEPTNAVFLRQYEDILDRVQLEEGRGSRVRVEPQEKRTFAVLAIAVITLLASLYLVLSPERPVSSQLGIISTWTIGLIVMLFVAGATAGAALGIGNLVDRMDAYSNGRMPPSVIYGLVSILSFPLAAAYYVVAGFSQKAFNFTTSRMMITVGGITLCLGLAASVPASGTSFVQTLIWGGNLVYLGALGGWTLADTLRH